MHLPSLPPRLAAIAKLPHGLIYRLIPSFWQRHKNFDYFSGSFHLWHVGPMPRSMDWWWAANGVAGMGFDGTPKIVRGVAERISSCWTRTAHNDIMQFVSVPSAGRTPNNTRMAKAMPMHPSRNRQSEQGTKVFGQPNRTLCNLIFGKVVFFLFDFLLLGFFLCGFELDLVRSNETAPQTSLA